jgi:hypothetical protein
MVLVTKSAFRRAFTGRHVNLILQRTSLSQNNRGLSSSSLIPDATWSIQDLELTSSTHESIPQSELDRLSRQCLLIIPNESTIPQDLSNMLHMVRQVQSMSMSTDTTLLVPPASLTSVEIYDDVRGVTVAPLRDVPDPLEQQDNEQAQQVYKSLLQPKTKRLGGTEYFSVQTKGN